MCLVKGGPPSEAGGGSLRDLKNHFWEDYSGSHLKKGLKENKT